MSETEYRVWQVVVELLKLSGLVIGALWVAWRFRAERTHAAQIAFSVDARVYGPIAGRNIVECLLTVHNQGRTAIRLEKLSLRLLGLEPSGLLASKQGLGARLDFPVKVMEDRQIILPKYRYYFCEPGVKQEIRYVTHAEASLKHLLLQGWFFYKNRDKHTAERVIEVSIPPPACSKPGRGEGPVWIRMRAGESGFPPSAQ